MIIIMEDLYNNPLNYYSINKDKSYDEKEYKLLLDRLPTNNNIKISRDDIFEKIDLILKNPSGNKDLNIPTKKEAKNWFKRFLKKSKR